MNWLIVDEIIKNALKEDIPSEDITTIPIVTEDSLCSVNLISKEDGILAGAEVFARVFYLLGEVDVSFNKEDGDILKKGEIIAIIKGKTKNVLLGERVALNLLQRMCGIATLTNNFSKKLIGTNAKLADTRKTTPNLRILEKYSVKIGGGINHRCNLSDGILIKDNHIDAAGSITNAINLIRKNSSFVRKIEVETENLDMVKEALTCNADIIMLDNMSIDEMKKSLKNLEESDCYDVGKYTYSLLHQTRQLEYFYCQLLEQEEATPDQTFYHVSKRPEVHQMAYFNIGRGFPKEIMDAHWCYVLKDFGSKMLVIPCTSIKEDSPEASFYELDIDVRIRRYYIKSRMQLSDMRCVDIQRLDLRKRFCNVVTSREEIERFIKENVFGEDENEKSLE